MPTRRSFASAYISSAGVEFLLPELKKILARGGKVSVYATFDLSVQTRPDAFVTLLRLVADKRYKALLKLYLYPSAQSLFHAKVFLVRKGRTWSALVGSANLTQAAFSGSNFETAVDCAPLESSQVDRLLVSLNDLRKRNLLVEVTEGKLATILSYFSIGEEELEEDPKARQVRREKAQAQRARQKGLVDALRPDEPLPLIDLAGLSPRDIVTQICATGIGVGVTTDLEGLSFSIKLQRFVTAGLISEETSKKVDENVNKTQKSGFSFNLIPGELRAMVSSAGRVAGKQIGSRAIDLGYVRWVPRVLFGSLCREIERSPQVREAERLLRTDDGALREHLGKVRRGFDESMAGVAREVELLPAENWDSKKLAELEREAGRTKVGNRSPEAIRAMMAALLVSSYRESLSEDFIRTRLQRVSFVPRSFEFPVEQTLDGDVDHGLKYFLACMTWAYTDRVLKRSSGGEGRGEVYRYLQARAIEAKTGGKPNAMAEAAGAWLGPDVSLDKSVEEFTGFFGPRGWNWRTQGS